MTRSFLALAVALPLLVTPIEAQEESPEAVVQQLQDAMKASDWARMAGLTHPVALHQLRKLLDPLLSTEGAGLDTARRAVFGFSTREEAVAASDSMVMVALIRFGMTQQPRVADALRSSSFRLLGTVHEGPDTVHVVGRISMTFNGTAGSQIETTSLMRFGSTWRALMKGDWTNMASRLRAALAQSQRVLTPN